MQLVVKNNDQLCKKPKSKIIEVNDSFDPALPNTKDVNVAVSLLQRKEESILLTVVEALSKYASKSKNNVEILFNLDILSNLLPIIEHEDMFVRRFATKLLVEMISLPDVISHLIESDYVPYFAKLLTSEEDIFMQEYFSAILAKLSKDPYGTALLAKHCPNVDFLFEMLQSADPDVRRNNVEILYNLMQDHLGAYNISKTKELDLCLLYQYFVSPYPEIQHFALDVLADIIARNKDEVIQSSFRETNGVKILLDFLENDKWVDLHVKALRILCFATENLATVDEFINAGGTSQILNHLERARNSNFFTEMFRIIVNVANTPNGRQLLHSHEIIDYLIDVLQRFTQSDVVEVICYGIGKMALHDSAAKELTERKCLETVFDLVKKEELQWSAKYAAIFAVRQLLMGDIRNCEIFFEMHGVDYLLQLLKKFVEQVPVEVCIIALEILIIVARYSSFKGILINVDINEIMFTFLQSTHPFIDEFKIACYELLSILCIEEDQRRYFFKTEICETLYHLIIQAPSISIRNAAILLVQTINIDLTVAKVFAYTNLFSYILNNNSFSRVIPSWDSCMETLFKSNLPMKFAFKGRLSENDITQDKFYLSRRSIRPFLILHEIWDKACPLEPMYLINCMQIPMWATLHDSNEGNKILDREFVIQCDLCDYFSGYLKEFQCIILRAESEDIAKDVKLVDASYIVSRAKALAKFVARQMCGLCPEIKSINGHLEIHLKKIKESIETSIIPLGQLRVGSYLERALLFKAIADRLCLPVALVRGEYGISWIEIAIPQMRDLSDISGDNAKSLKINDDPSSRSLKNPISAYECETEEVSMRNRRSKIFPVKLIRPNFIIDLMDTPGDFIQVGSRSAKLYCTRKLTENKNHH
ncbi:hypothetical protein HN011_002424 [Eciton burchellii]|nr:hypothetical protein HN011_002424 [Eciton burchellii]